MTSSPHGKANSPTYYPPCADLDFSVAGDPLDASGRVCVHVRGEVDLSTSPALGQQLDKVCAAGCRWVEVDMGAVDFLAAAGLHEFVRVAESLSHVDGRLVVMGLSAQQRRMFAITGLTALVGP